MANVVEIVVSGKDLSGPALKSASNNAQTLSKDMRGLGSVMNQTGNIAQALGQQHFAQLANQATLLTIAGKELIGTFSKVNIVKASLIGLAVVAGAVLVEHVMAGKEAEEARAEAIQNSLDLYFELHEQTIRMVNEDQANYEREEIQHRRNLERIQELVDAGAGGNQLMQQEDMRHTTAKWKIFKATEEKTTQFKAEQLKKQIALNVRYSEGTATIFGNLASAAQAFGKKGFEAFKAFRIAEAIASTYAGAARALADYPWPYSIVVAASVVAAGIANVATIAASKPAGQAHGGLTSVPTDQTLLVQEGERIIKTNQNEDLTAFLESRSGGATAVQVNIDGRELFRVLNQASADGRLVINAKAVK